MAENKKMSKKRRLEIESAVNAGLIIVGGVAIAGDLLDDNSLGAWGTVGGLLFGAGVGRLFKLE